MQGFKTTPMGFSKKEVTAYIKDLSIKYEQNIKEKDAIIAQLEQKIDELTQNLSQKEQNDADK